MYRCLHISINGVYRYVQYISICGVYRLQVCTVPVYLYMVCGYFPGYGYPGLPGQRSSLYTSISIYGVYRCGYGPGYGYPGLPGQRDHLEVWLGVLLHHGPLQRPRQAFLQPSYHKKHFLSFLSDSFMDEKHCIHSLMNILMRFFFLKNVRVIHFFFSRVPITN